MNKVFNFKVDPDNRYCEARKVQPVTTYVMSNEELATYKTEPYKKPFLPDLKQNRQGGNEMETTENTIQVKKEIKLTDALIKQEIANGLTSGDLAAKYGKKEFWVRGRMNRIEQAERKEQPCLIEPKKSNHKYDTGKPRLDLVPPGIIEAVGIIRTYGTEKYGDPDGWKEVEANRYVSAMMRHMVEYLRDKNSVDKESGLPHMWHIACNVAFLIEFKEMETKKQVAKEQEGQA